LCAYTDILVNHPTRAPSSASQAAITRHSHSWLSTVYRARQHRTRHAATSSPLFERSACTRRSALLPWSCPRRSPAQSHLSRCAPVGVCTALTSALVLRVPAINSRSPRVSSTS
jgi:hypothetical protein